MAIYIPSGGISTKDATALPSDVAKDKIFYNAFGRQVGTYQKPPFEMKTMVLPAQTDEWEEERYVNTYVEYGYYGYAWRVRISSDDMYLYYLQTIDGINGILGLQVNDGNFQFLPSVGLFDSSLPFNDRESDLPFTVYGEEWFGYDAKEKRMYLYWPPSDMKITVYYI